MQKHQPKGGPLTVLHVTQPVDGGVARVVTDLVRARLATGLRVALACPPSAFATALAAQGAEVHFWEAGREPGARLPRETADIARIVRRAAPDVVHAHSAKAGLAARLALRGRLPTVFQPHAWSFEAVTGLPAHLALRWERHAARWAARVLCVSEEERRRGRSAGIDARWEVIRNGVDTGRFTPVPDEEAARARARLLPCAVGAEAGAGTAGTPLVVCVGRLCRQKGQDVLLRAWPAVTARLPGARLVLVGDGPDREALRAAAPAGVLFAGADPDPAPWYAAADLAVQPSRWEGMALAPLEAMACGRPVLLTDVAGARESLPAGQDAACLVPPEDPDALAAALVGLLTDRELRTALGEQARRHVRATGDVAVTTAAVEALYRELTGRPHHGRDREELISR